MSLSSVPVLEPSDARELAAVLQTAGAAGRTVLPRGSGTKLHWGLPVDRVDTIVSTKRLTAPLDHRPGDLTATIPAGATLAVVNAVLARAGQWLPLDPEVSPAATIGGIVATNDSGPRRHLFGTPRDLIIGIEMALADGRRARAGGQVVKNVAGYDLSRLLCGSFGSLAVITSATFKLAPRPKASRTIETEPVDAARAGGVAQAIAAAPLTPSAIEIDGPPYRLIVRLESTATSADRQAKDVLVLCQQHGTTARLLEEEAEAAVWRELASRLAQGPGSLLKLAVLPTRVADLLQHLEQVAADHQLTFAVHGRAGLGVLFVRLGAVEDRQLAAIRALRNHAEGGRGSLVVLAAPDAVRRRLDVWGVAPGGLRLMHAVKARFDPGGTLSPGRGPGGL